MSPKGGLNAVQRLADGVEQLLAGVKFAEIAVGTRFNDFHCLLVGRIAGYDDNFDARVGFF